MDQAIKRKWVKALLSGEYKQGKSVLSLNGKFCCLGVLNEVCNLGSSPLAMFLSSDSEKQVGLNYSESSELAVLNDAGVPFDMIAGLIDEAL